MTHDERDTSIVRWLAEKVMGWTDAGGGHLGIWVDASGESRGFAIGSWADAGMVWEKARKIGYYLSLCGQPGFKWAAFDPTMDDDSGSLADSGPRALCEAVALATGWKARRAGQG